MYVRIESEPFNPLSFKPAHTYYSTVRQIFINVNQSNMDEKYRPLVIFYDGPEQMEANSSVRDSQPVVLTLNDDARVILFAPNSPVVIRGNNHKMQGFVIAKEYDDSFAYQFFEFSTSLNVRISIKHISSFR